MTKYDLKMRYCNNKAIIERLLKLVEEHPQLRFKQLLINEGIIDDNPKDWCEESEETWKILSSKN